VWAVSENPKFEFDGISPGAALTAAEQRAAHGTLIRSGQDDFYLVSDGAATAVLRARAGVVAEVGIAERRLTGSRADRMSLLASLA
jgi:hypothetical protein